LSLSKDCRFERFGGTERSLTVQTHVSDEILGGLVAIKEAHKVIDLTTPGRATQRIVSSRTFQLLEAAGMDGDCNVTPEVHEAFLEGLTAPVTEIDCLRDEQMILSAVLRQSKRSLSESEESYYLREDYQQRLRIVKGALAVAQIVTSE